MAGSFRSAKTLFVCALALCGASSWSRSAAADPFLICVFQAQAGATNSFTCTAPVDSTGYRLILQTDGSTQNGSVSVDGTAVSPPGLFPPPAQAWSWQPGFWPAGDHTIEMDGLDPGGVAQIFLINEGSSEACWLSTPTDVTAATSPASWSFNDPDADPAAIPLLLAFNVANGSGPWISPSLQLNGQEILGNAIAPSTSLVIAGPAGFAASNMVLASVPAGMDILVEAFLIDQTAPSVTVQSVTSGSPSVTATGTVSDPSAIVVVNGVTATISGNAWTAPVDLSGTSTITAVATDFCGNQATTTLTVGGGALVNVSAGELGPQLPGEQDPVAFTAQNTGSDSASVTVTMTNLDSSTPSTTYSVGGGSWASASLTTAGPAVPGPQSGETDAQYLARLQGIDQSAISYAWTADWSEDSSTGSASGSVATVQVLPVLTLNLVGPETAAPGDPVSFSGWVMNTGSADATGGTATLTFPDATSGSASLALVPGNGAAWAFAVPAFSSAWQVPVPTPRGAGETNSEYLNRLLAIDGTALSTSAALNWTDGISNSYGPIQGSYATTEQVPALEIVSVSGPDHPLLPDFYEQNTTASVQNVGSGPAVAEFFVISADDVDVSNVAEVLPGAQVALGPQDVRAPMLPPRQPGASDAEYAAFLSSLDGSPVPYQIQIVWQPEAPGDAWAFRDPPVPTLGPEYYNGTAYESVANVTATLSAPSSGHPGEVLSYTLTLTDNGSAEVANSFASVGLPDLSTQVLVLGPIASGGTTSQTFTWTVPPADSGPPPAPPLDAAPVAWFASNISVAAGATATLPTNLSDDGLPNWPEVFCLEMNGPGSGGSIPPCGNVFANMLGIEAGPTRNVQFDVQGFIAEPTQVQLSFPQNGEYLLGISMNDGLLGTHQETKVFVGEDSDGNQGPLISMGASQSITGLSATVSATVTDSDGLPSGTLSTQWTLFRGPGTATFDDPTAQTTNVTFSQPGQYILQLSATDTQLTNWTQTLVEVTGSGYAPVAEQVLDQSLSWVFGTDASVATAGPANPLTIPFWAWNVANVTSVWASADGLPAPGPGIGVEGWQVVSGPDSYLMVDYNTPSHDAFMSFTFDTPGLFVVGGTFGDGALETHVEFPAAVGVAVDHNQCPQIELGPAQYVPAGDSALLTATVRDDGLPLSGGGAPGSLTLQWSVVSGPGGVTFTDASAAQTRATFQVPGEYVLKLSATDGELTAWKETLIEQEAVPRVSENGGLLSTVATVAWQDDSGQTYGPIYPSATTNLPQLTLAVSASSAAPGQVLTYTVTLTNTGYADATEVSAPLTLPDGSTVDVTFDVIAAGASASQSVTYTVPVLTRGSSETVSQYTTRLQAADGTTHTATVNVYWEGSGGADFGSTSSSVTYTEHVPILQISASTPSTLTPGVSGQITYTVQNIGSGDASGATLTVTEPAGNTVGGATFSLAAGQSTTITRPATAPALDQRGSGESDSDYLLYLQSADNTTLTFNADLNWNDSASSTLGDVPVASTSTEIVPVVNASLTSPAGISPGGTITYTLALSNTGHADATGVSASISLPDGSAPPVNISTVAAGATASATFNVSVGSIAARGSSESVSAYIARLQTFDGKSFAATSTVSWLDATDAFYGSLAPASTTLEQVPIVTVTLGTVPQFQPNQSSPIPFTVHNIGSGDAHTAKVTVRQPDGTTVSSATFALAAGASSSLSVNAAFPAVGPIGSGQSQLSYLNELLEAGVNPQTFVYDTSWQDAVGDLYGSTGASFTANEPVPILTVSVSTPASAEPGTNVAYTVTLYNEGSASAMNAAITVTLPDGSTASPTAMTVAANTTGSYTGHWTIPAISPIGSGESAGAYLSRLAASQVELHFNASVVWQDSPGTNYGATTGATQMQEQVPIVSIAAASAGGLLPGASQSVSFPVSNAGFASALATTVHLSGPHGNTADPAAFTLASGAQTTTSITDSVPAFAPKGGSETDAQYLARLQGVNGTPLSYAWTVQWQDASGDTYGPISGSATADEVVPIVTAVVDGPEQTYAGDPAFFTVTVTNSGGARAPSFTAHATWLDGSSGNLSFPVASLPPGQSTTQTHVFTLPTSLSSGAHTSSVALTWDDALSSDYGSLSGSVTTQILGLNQPPAVSAGPALTVTLPAPAHLNGSASDDGLPAGSTLTTEWLQLSGPGTTVFNPKNTPVSTATFSAPGTYVLQLIGSDGDLTSTSNVTVTVSASPGAIVGANGGNASSGGTMINLTQSPNQIALSNTTSPFNRVWIAVSSKGTVVKFDAVSGAILGEFWTAPEGQPMNPSRTTVDHNGNAWVANRDGNSVTRIGLLENGGCEDRNGDGLIETSQGQGDVRPWPNTNGEDSAGGVLTAQDECIVNYVIVHSGGTRHLTVDRNDDVWVSGTIGRAFDLIDGRSGLIKRTEAGVGYGGYGGLLDSNGVIWSSNPMIRWDPSYPLSGPPTLNGAPSGTNWSQYTHPNYGLCIDPSGNVWSSSMASLIYKHSPAGAVLGSYSQGNTASQGCAIDANGDVWVAHSRNGSSTVGHLKNNGTYVGDVTTGDGPTGVAVDAAGKIWATNFSDETVVRINPSAGSLGADGVTHIGAVDFTSPPLGGTLYNYSDMTGATLYGPPQQGTWTVVFDSKQQGATWGLVYWTAQIYGDGAIAVKVAANDNQYALPGPQASAAGATTASAPIPVQNDVPFMGVTGRYLQATVTLTRSTDGETPVLYSLIADTQSYTDSNQPTNKAPLVNAGPNQTITWPIPLTLTGEVQDDGLPGNHSLQVTWSQVSPALSTGHVATFASPGDEKSVVTFSAPDTYVLQLEGNDGALNTTSNVTITVNAAQSAPVVTMGASQTLTYPTLTTTVAASATEPGHSLTYQWTQVEGPSGVSIGLPTHASTSVTFPGIGDYVLQFTATDGTLTASGTLDVYVQPASSSGQPTLNKAPVMSFGPNAAITGPSSNAVLLINWSDDSLPLWAPGYCLESAENSSGSDIEHLSGSTCTDLFPVYLGVESGPSRNVYLNYNGPDIPANTPGIEVTTPANGQYLIGATYSDGQLLSHFETLLFVGGTSDSNTAPAINMGAGQYIAQNQTLTLSGPSVTDDGLPNGTVTTTWSQFSGPGTVMFGNVSTLHTTATFSSPGEYVLQLSATDGQLTTWRTMLVEVTSSSYTGPTIEPVLNHAPFISFPANSSIASTSVNAVLPMIMGDDDFPFWPPGYCAAHTTSSSYGAATYCTQNYLTWVNVVSGPSHDVIFNLAAPDAPAHESAVEMTFPVPGTYIIGATQNDGQMETHFETAVFVGSSSDGNQAPQIAMPEAQWIPLGQPLQLSPTVTDDGTPMAYTTTWSVLAGPGSAIFANPALAGTTVTFSAAGEYILQLTAYDGQLTSWTTTLVEVTSSGYSDPPTAQYAQNHAPYLALEPNVSLSAPSSTAEAVIGVLTADDGLPVVPGTSSAISYASWEVVNGPSHDVAFDLNPASPPTGEKGLGVYNFPLVGDYLIGLTVTDGQLTAHAETPVTVGAAADTNHGPQIDMGPSQSIPLGVQASLFAQIYDDGLPYGVTNVTWSVSGTPPGSVNFTDPDSPITQATFGAAGNYILQLTATDGELTAWEQTLVVVGTAPAASSGAASYAVPLVSAGPDQTITFPTATVALNGSASEPGLTAGTAIPVLWSQVSGPTATIAAPSSVATTASFITTGTYVFKLTATYGELFASSTVQITVNGPPGTTNHAPVVSFSSTAVTLNLPVNQSSVTPNLFDTIGSTVTDDALPSRNLWLTWSQINGPAPVTISAPTSPPPGFTVPTLHETNVNASTPYTYDLAQLTFTQPGVYIMALSAFDGALTTSASVQFTVQRTASYAAPTVTASVAPTWIEEPASGPAVVTLTGTVTDSGVPFASVTQTWSASGPGSVTFGNANQPITTASFIVPGNYTFTLTASNTQNSGSAQTTLTAYPADPGPSVAAGVVVSGVLQKYHLTYPTRTLALADATASLSVSPVPPGMALSYEWTLADGPAPVSFSNATALHPTVTFETSGTYYLSLTANDTVLASTSTVEVDVDPPGGGLPTVALGVDLSAVGGHGAHPAGRIDRYLADADPRQRERRRLGARLLARW
jgi:uncharacterized repeat protein (TIGR01451 family)